MLHALETCYTDKNNCEINQKVIARRHPHQPRKICKDHLPLIPSQLFKAGFRFKVTPKATVGVDFLARSDSFYRGDESNVADKIGSFAVANLRAEYTISENLQLYMNINNLLDSDYETFGLFGDATDVLGDDFGDSRFLSPGAHRAAWFGVRSNF